MKLFHLPPKWLKICLSLLLALILVTFFGKPIIAFSLSNAFKFSDKNLYEMYFANERNGNHFQALLYLFAYQTREPSTYLNNSAHNSYVKSEVKRLTGIVDKALTLQNKVNADLNSCGCYPCGGCANTSRVMNSNPTQPPPQIVQPPPDVAVVCEHYEHQGRCLFLNVGDYNTPEQMGLPNDTISSVMVGGGVKLTLCSNGGMTGYCTTFSPDTRDSNLSDNPLVDQFNWNDNTTSIRVEWR